MINRQSFVRWKIGFTDVIRPLFTRRHEWNEGKAFFVLVVDLEIALRSTGCVCSCCRVSLIALSLRNSRVVSSCGCLEHCTLETILLLVFAR